MSKLQTGKLYYFNFAGQVLKGKLVGEDKLTDGTTIYILKDNKYKYPIRKKDILCGNSKQ
jgi:hypothetical protein